MKKLIISIIDKLGYRAIEKDFYEYLINISAAPDDAFGDILEKIINKEQTICCFDIGANIGQTVTKIRTHYPGSIIYCFEPVKDTYVQLVKNLAGYPNINTYNCAMGGSAGEVEIFHREHSEWNSLLQRSNEDAKKSGATSEIIKVDTIDNFVVKEGITRIDILKSDTEGFELEVLKGARIALEKGLICTLYIEVGFSKEDSQHSYWIEVVQEVEKYGYRFVGLFEKCYGSAMNLEYANALFCSGKIIKGENNRIL